MTGESLKRCVVSVIVEDLLMNEFFDYILRMLISHHPKVNQGHQ